MDKENVVYIHHGVLYYLAIKSNESVLFEGIMVELEIIMLNEISKIQKGKYNIFSYIC
jgi:hypothetical protein